MAEGSIRGKNAAPFSLPIDLLRLRATQGGSFDLKLAILDGSFSNNVACAGGDFRFETHQFTRWRVVAGERHTLGDCLAAALHRRVGEVASADEFAALLFQFRNRGARVA